MFEGMISRCLWFVLSLTVGIFIGLQGLSIQRVPSNFVDTDVNAWHSIAVIYDLDSTDRTAQT
jgi:hypothetical protein